MQLILTHADLEAALINDLRNKGMTAFEPGKASVDFSFKRGTKELVCTLDTDPKPEAPVDPKPAAASSATQTATTSASAAKAQDSAQAAAAEEPANTAPAEVAATTAEAPVETAAAGAADDNLFD